MDYSPPIIVSQRDSSILAFRRRFGFDGILSTVGRCPRRSRFIRNESPAFSNWHDEISRMGDGMFRKEFIMNDGKDLENLAALIESVHLPEGFLIERNLKPRDEYGNQIAELDVVISGRIGSTPFKMLIECRDRPSDGAAPGSWIEQLATRKRRFDFNTVIAVSSTGFAPGAPQLAEDENIILRTMNELTPDDVSSHIPFFCPIVMNEPRVKSIAVHLETTPSQTVQQNRSL
jgi:hypothetical protein